MPWGVAAAAVASVAGAAISSSSSAAASGKAAKAQQTAAAQAASQTEQQQEQTRADQLPHINSGNAAANQLSYLLGLTPQGSNNQGMLGSAGTDAASTLPSNIASAIKSFTSKSPNLAYPDGTNSFVNHTASQLASESPDQYASELASLGLPSDTPQSTFANAMNGTGGTGTAANNGYGDTVNTDTGAYGSLTHNFDATDFANNMDPAYAWDVQQGQDALQRTQSANGGLLSGAAGKAISDYTTNQASNEYQNAYNRYNTNQTNLYNRLAGVSGTGMQGASDVASNGTTAANNASNLITGAGTAQGAGITGQANAGNAGIAGIVQSLGGVSQNQGFNSLFGNSSNTGIPSGGFASQTGVPFNTQYE